MATNLPSPSTQSQVVSEAAQSFVDAYYDSLNKRQPLAPYYTSSSTLLTQAGVKPDISVNGKVLDSVAALESLLDSQGKPVHYDVASFDAQPVNPAYALGCPESLVVSQDQASSSQGGPRNRNLKSLRDGERISFVVHVSGTVKYGKGRPVAPAPAVNGGATGAAAGTAAAAAPADGPIEKVFTEAWLLVPHWEALSRNAPRGLRNWVVVSQNFRAL